MKIQLNLFIIPFILISYTCLGHNGKTAYSYPLNKIKIDGKLADWPKEVERYKINNFLGQSSNNVAYFQTGYDLENGILFVAVIVYDELNKISNHNNNIFWNSEDKQILYIDPEHGKDKGSSVLTIGASQSGFILKKVSENWDVYNKSFTKNAINVKVRHKNGKTVYEWALNLGQSVKENKSIGLDFLISDYDGEDKPTENLVWSEGGVKEFIPLKLGDLILLPENEKIGKVQGVVEWNEKTFDNLPKSYKIQSITKPYLWTTVNIDSIGNYDINLPIGDYSINPSQNVTNAFSFDKKKRIDELASIYFSASETKTKNNDTLKLDIYGSPRFLIPARGILNNEKINIEQIDNFVKTYKNYCNAVGLSLAIIKNGDIVYNKHFGIENSISQKPIDSNSVFEIASVSKTIFAFAVNNLAEKGVIDLDKPLFQYLPFEQLSDDERAKTITARHILSHQSGLPNWAWGGPYGWENGGKIKLLFEPGSKYQYSGEGYEYLKRVIEEITKKDIQSIINEEVYLPFRMIESSFTASPKIKDRIVVGHTEYTPMFWGLHDKPWISGSMYSTSKDMAIFMQGLMNKKVLSSKNYEEMFKPQIKNNEPWRHFFGGKEQYHSLGFEIEDTPLGRIIHHGGNNGDFQARFAMDWESKNGFVLLTNNNNGFALDLILQEFFFSGRLSNHNSTEK